MIYEHLKNQKTYESRYSRIDQVKFVEDCLSKPYHFKFLTWPIFEYLDPYIPKTR